MVERHFTQNSKQDPAKSSKVGEGAVRAKDIPNVKPQDSNLPADLRHGLEGNITGRMGIICRVKQIGS